MPLERSSLDALQLRIDQIRATGDEELAARAWRTLSAVLRGYFVEATGRDPQQVVPTDVRLYLQSIKF